MDRGAFVLPGLAIVVLGTFWYSEHLAKNDPVDGKVHVKYWEKWTDFEFDSMKHVVDVFNSEHPNIQVDILSVSGIQDKTLMAISGNIPPDVAGLYGGNVTQYADDHAVYTLDDMCKEAGISADQYVPAFWNVCTVRNHIYAMPTTPASVALHWNKDMFKVAGLNPDKPPATWEEVAQMADKITTRDPGGHIKQAGFLPAEPGWWNWMWGPLFGGKLYEVDAQGKGHVTINSPDNVRGFEYCASFAKKYGPGNLSTFRNGFGQFSSPQNGFLAGHLAMEPQGVWMYNFITKFAPDLKWSAAELPYPADRPDLKAGTIIDLDVLCIPRGAKHVKEAFEFVKFVESQRGMEMLCLGQKKASPLIKVSPEFYARHPNPYIKLFAELPKGKNAYAVPKVGIWPEYTSEIDSAFSKIMLEQETPQKALDDVANRMQPKLEQYESRLKARGEQ